MRMFDIPAKWKSFGWHVKEIDGHDIRRICDAIEWMKQSNDGPTLMIFHANTVKGKGISFMENNPAFHGAAPNDEQLAQALEELEVGPMTKMAATRDG